MPSRRRLPAFLSLSCVFLTPMLGAVDCAPDSRSDKKAGILVTDFSITGSQTLSSTEIAGITGELTGACFDDDSEELGERIRALYQERGYFAAEVKSVHLKPSDPLKVPKPVSMEAEVAEGPRYKLGEIGFVANHAFSAERLRQEFPLKKGDVFSRGKVASGLESLRRVYGSRGFLDFMAIPETKPSSNATLNLNISVDEGPQYHMGKVEFIAKKELAARLQMAWKLDEGAVYDQTYIDQYIEANRASLPSGFTRGDVKVSLNCPDALVDLRVMVDAAEDTSRSQPKDVPCEAKEGKGK